MDQALEGESGPQEILSRFFLYQTAQRVYLVATSKSQQQWRLLKFDKTAALGDLDVIEDAATYTKAQVSRLCTAGRRSSWRLLSAILADHPRHPPLSCPRSAHRS
jgi:hypothetical protein